MIKIYFTFTLNGKKVTDASKSFEEESEYRKYMAHYLRTAHSTMKCEKLDDGYYEITTECDTDDGHQVFVNTMVVERDASYGELHALQAEFDKQTEGHEWECDEERDECFLDFCDQYTHMNDNPKVNYA